jgi:hypothetical protein
MPAFSLFAILGVEGLRLRLRNRCGLGLNRNPPFLEGHQLEKGSAVHGSAVNQSCFFNREP